MCTYLPCVQFLFWTEGAMVSKEKTFLSESLPLSMWDVIVCPQITVIQNRSVPCKKYKTVKGLEGYCFLGDMKSIVK